MGTEAPDGGEFKWRFRDSLESILIPRRFGESGTVIGWVGETLVGDSAKGAVPVILGAGFSLTGTALIAVGLAAFIGHLFPVFLGFKGGKGVATAAGVLLALDYRLGLGVLAVWIGLAALTRYSSLAALVAAASAPLLAYALGGTTLTGIALLGVMSVALIAKHSANIKRLLTGEEGRIGKKKG